MKNKEFEYLVKPLSILFVLMVLIVAIGVFGYKQVVAVTQKVAELKTIQLKLHTKLDILENVKVTLDENINFIDLVLPRKSSVLYGLAQIKKLAAINSIIVSNIKAGSAILEDNGISKYSINFEAEGNDDDIQEFLSAFFKALPIMTLNKIKIDKIEGITRTSVTMNIYSADLPDKIPAVTESVNELSERDLSILKELIEYTQPDFFDPKPSQTIEKEDPFN